MPRPRPSRGSPHKKLDEDHPEKVSATVLRRKAVDLRIKGYSFGDIATELGVSRTQAFRLVQGALKVHNRRLAEKAEELIRVEEERLDRAVKGLMKKVDAGDTRAAEVLVRISESRRKLHGLDAPEKKQIAVGVVDFTDMNDPELVTWAERFGINVSLKPLEENALPYCLPGEVIDAVLDDPDLAADRPVPGPDEEPPQ